MQSHSSYTATRYYMKRRTVDIRGLFISRYTVLRYIVTSLLVSRFGSNYLLNDLMFLGLHDILVLK